MRLIDADALIAQMEADAEHIEEPIAKMFAYAAINDVKHTPTIEERKTGEWIEFDSDDDKYDIIKCQCCKHTFTVDSYHWTDIGFVKSDFKYCPNCGADMRGDEHE